MNTRYDHYQLYLFNANFPIDFSRLSRHSLLLVGALPQKTVYFVRHSKVEKQFEIIFEPFALLNNATLYDTYQSLSSGATVHNLYKTSDFIRHIISYVDNSSVYPLYHPVGTKSLRFFNKVTELEKIPFCKHRLMKMHKSQKPESSAFVKKIDDYFFYEGNRRIARQEVIAQEFMRLMEPHFPKTRVIEDDQFNVYVSSKFDPEARPLSSGWVNDLIQGKFKGLGAIYLHSLVLNEIDLKKENLLVDSEGRLIKIDGDWCFAHTRSAQYCNRITGRDIKSLPQVFDFCSYNWIGQFYDGKSKLIPSLLKLAELPFFKKEIYQAILKWLILPHDIISKLINHHTNDAVEVNNLFNFIIDSRQQLFFAVRENTDFCEYMRNEQTKKDVYHFSVQCLGFTLTKKVSLIIQTEEKIDFASTLINEFQIMLANLVSPEISVTLSP